MKRIIKLETRVEKVEEGQLRPAVLMVEIGKRPGDFDPGRLFRLQDVKYDEAGQTLNGRIREKKVQYRRKKR